MSIGSRTLEPRDQHATPVADQMTLAPALGPISGIWTGLVTAVDRADETTVHDRPRPINLVGACEPLNEAVDLIEAMVNRALERANGNYENAARSWASPEKDCS